MTRKADAKSWTVLVVDDSEDFLRAACSWLETQPDLDVAGTARDGLGALALVESVKPDLVIMDAVMPSMDGFEATRRIKERPGAPRVVVVSLHDSEATRDEAWVSGADGFVAKADLMTALPPLVRSLREGAAGGSADGPRDEASGASERPRPRRNGPERTEGEKGKALEREARESGFPFGYLRFTNAWWRSVAPWNQERKEEE